MTVGAGRPVGAWMMAVSAMVLATGALVLDSAVDALEQQVADLDESEVRAAATSTKGAIGVALMASGLLFFLIGWITYGIGSHRARSHHVPTESRDGSIAGAAGITVLLALAFVFVLPFGPGALALGVAGGGGGASGAVQLEIFEGDLSSASFGVGPNAGPVNAENLHDFNAVASRGALKMRLVSGGMPDGVFPIAILEATDGRGGWEEVAQTSSSADSEVAVPVRDYPGALRFRVALPAGSAGSVQYGLAVSFDPAT